MFSTSFETLRSRGKYLENLYRVVLFVPREKWILQVNLVLATMASVLKQSRTKVIAFIETCVIKNAKAMMKVMMWYCV